MIAVDFLAPERRVGISSRPMNKAVQWKLFVMMVLEFFIWGAWLPLIAGYLGGLNFTTVQQTLILDAFPVASIIGMFFGNQFADRNFAAEKFLGFSQLVGGLAMLALGFTHDFGMFFALMSIHCLLYVPTMSIVNSITFANLKDPKEFGLVRMGGTIGWVLAAWPSAFIFVDWDKVKAANPAGLVNWFYTVFGSGLSGSALQEATHWTFIVAGIASLLLAVFSLTLPHTPPKKVKSGENKFAWKESLRLLSKPYVLVLWLVTFVDASVHNSYFVFAGTFLGSPQVGIKGNWIMPIMSIGQVAEILSMAVLGLALKKLGWRTTMIFGICGQLVRFLVFAFLPQATGVIIAVIVVHGICYAFFFAAVYIFVDEHFPSDVRSSAQGLFNVMIFGFGAISAYTVGPWLIQKVFTTAGVTDFRGLFLVPSAVALVAVIVMALFFHPPDRGSELAGAGKPAHA
jgi:MFS family permease